MAGINRRDALIGSGLALSVGGCDWIARHGDGGDHKGGGAKFFPPPGPYSPKDFDPGVNQGHDPGADNPSGDVPFKPKYVALIYVTFLAYPKIEMDVVRVHFPIRPNQTEWGDIESDVASWINYLNSQATPTQVRTTQPQLCASPQTPHPSPKPTPMPSPSPIPTASPSPTPTASPSPAQAVLPANTSALSYKNGPTDNSCWVGIKDLAFKDQQHVVIYIRNEGVYYNYDWPIWFGTHVHGPVLGTLKPNHQATLNDTFYNSRHPKTSGMIDAGWSNQVVHFKNYYQTLDSTTGKYRLVEKEVPVYSLNVNAWIGTGMNSPQMQVIFDPDTGNMGGGQP